MLAGKFDTAYNDFWQENLYDKFSFGFMKVIYNAV